MAKIETTVSVTIKDARGEVWQQSRTLVTSTQDNPIFWAGKVKGEVAAAGGTVTDAVKGMFGDRPDDDEGNA